MRKIWDIHGGIHPLENKTQSLQAPIQTAPIAPQLVLPLSQHIGAPAKACVAVGDQVLKGQVIAQANGFVSVPVHAPTSGVVSAIEDRPVPHASGMSGPAIVLDTDGKDQWIEHSGIADYTQLDKAELCNRIREAGIAGMGGAGFPSAIKLNTRPDQPIETLIINGTECEPYITADDILMQERSEQVIAGVQILQHIVSPSKETLIGVEDNKPEAIAALRKAAEGTNIEVVQFPTKYPSGGEKQLIKILTGKEVPSGQLPASIGIVLQNVGTTVAIHNAVTKGEPLISRITTVTGNAVKKPQNYEVLLGTPMQHLLELSQFKEKKATRLIMGGPMMGFAMHSTAIPVVKTSNCILVPDKKEIPAHEHSQACIRCGMCAQACPVSLLPQQLYWFAQGKEYDKLEAHNLSDCIECGACSYSCPSNIPLVQYYRSSKAAIRTKNEEQKQAEHAKMRFDARQERLEKAEAEKEAKRLARQEAAKAAAEKKAKAAAAAKDSPAADSDDPVAAAVARAKAKAEQKAAASDPVQAAIDRAKAKAAGQPVAEVDPLEKAQQQVANFEKRLKAAQDKLEAAKEQGSDKVDAFASAVDKTQEKLDKARAELSELEAKAPAAAPAEDLDPAAAAIARAQAKRDNPQAADPKAELEAEIASLTKRIDKAKQKLDAADDDKKEILQTGLDKQQAKLEAAQTKLAELAPAKAEPTAAEEDLDPAAAAIARAQAKRNNPQAGDPKAELEAEIASLEKRIEKAKAKLDAADDDKKEILQTGLDKQQAKLDQAQAKLAALTPAATETAAEAEAPAKAAPVEASETQAETATAEATPSTPEEDLAQDAIARALAKRAGKDQDQDPKAKLESNIASLEKRIANTQGKLDAAKAEGSDKADVLASSLEKLQQKLDEAQQQLKDLA